LVREPMRGNNHARTIMRNSSDRREFRGGRHQQSRVIVG
jgi:hypothetical protein